MKDVLVKGIVIFAAGGIAAKAIKKVRQTRLEKELYETVEAIHTKSTDEE